MQPSDEPAFVPSPDAIRALARLLRSVRDDVPVVVMAGTGLTRHLVVTTAKSETPEK